MRGSIFARNCILFTDGNFLHGRYPAQLALLIFFLHAEPLSFHKVDRDFLPCNRLRIPVKNDGAERLFLALRADISFRANACVIFTLMHDDTRAAADCVSCNICYVGIQRHLLADLIFTSFKGLRNIEVTIFIGYAFAFIHDVSCNASIGRPIYITVPIHETILAVFRGWREIKCRRLNEPIRLCLFQNAARIIFRVKRKADIIARENICFIC